MADKNGTNGNTNGGTSAPKATKAELQKLFAAYDAAEKGVLAAEKALDKAKAAQSAAVGAICGAANAKGPFKREDGRILTGVERVNKETQTSTWFFKGPSQNDLIEL